ncbi:MAG TPA: prepilin-type N-terminal cleavage/methylation domain-containing protein [Candidatus Angelobacter sp.]
MKSWDNKPQTGFSLIELMVVVLLLSIVVGAIFTQINRAQVRYRVEDQRLDLTQQDRDFVDQFTRDLHQAGYPSPTQFGGRLDLSSKLTAVGIWSISPTDLKLEADVDGTGVVREIVYHYDDGTDPKGGGSACPCLRRSSSPKVDGLPWNQADPVYYTQVQNIIAAAGQPIFQAYAADGSVLPISAGKTLGSTAVTDPTYQFLLNIKNVRITFSTQAQGQDIDAHRSIQVTMTGMARLPNN